MALVWPAAGAGFLWFKAVLRWRGCRSPEWIGTVVALAVITLTINAFTGLTVVGNVGSTIANVVQSWVAAHLYLRSASNGLFHSRRRLFVLLMAATVGSCAAIPFGPLTQVMLGASWYAVPTWVLRNVSEIFLVAVLGLRLLRRHPEELARPAASQAAILTVSTLFVVWGPFGSSPRCR